MDVEWNYVIYKVSNKKYIAKSPDFNVSAEGKTPKQALDKLEFLVERKIVHSIWRLREAIENNAEFEIRKFQLPRIRVDEDDNIAVM